MKKTILSLSIAVGVIFCYFICQHKKMEALPLNADPIRNGIVANEEVALRLAEVVWLSIYGDEIYDHKPFKAKLQDSIWVVDGTVHAKLGGAPHIVLQKKDGKIIDVTHFK